MASKIGVVVTRLLIRFTETWLMHVHVDRKVTESGKRKRGGLCVFFNDKWCNRRHIIAKEEVCSRDI